MLDAPARLRSATLFCTGALETDPPAARGLPGPAPEVLAMWEHLGERRDREAEVAFNLEHWRLLSGAARGGPFEEHEFRALEERIRDHAGHDEPTAAHAAADPSNLARGAELARVRTPTLVIEAPLDPVFPPPHAHRLAELIPNARLVTVPRMGHALPSAVLEPLASRSWPTPRRPTSPSDDDPRCRHETVDSSDSPAWIPFRLGLRAPVLPDVQQLPSHPNR